MYLNFSIQKLESFVNPLKRQLQPMLSVLSSAEDFLTNSVVTDQNASVGGPTMFASMLKLINNVSNPHKKK